ncbi:response regulator transcription factor [Flammeovirgaceae bacterium SG7u.111]|nr:response regulator transcription factor [Flammeovirgaceae bacterium SG7u.132]WPO37840.1 response regulator transcription factor [Flammeovirgaceae bacterium SG7u.111]
MVSKYYTIGLGVFVSFLLLASSSAAQNYPYKGHIEVAMRMIGHEVLLHSGDSTSRVLPIEQEAGKYKIQFEKEFAFNPEELVAIIDQVVVQTKIADHYLVEVKECGTGQVVYSYEIGNSNLANLVPCLGRIQSVAHYSILITILTPSKSSAALQTASQSLPNNLASKEGSITPFSLGLLGIPLMFLIGLVIYLRKKRRNTESDPHLISIGTYQFDSRNMELVVDEQKIELTGKETALLQLLYGNVNATIQREVLLKEVWGDEGDYVGRTLDVYISKLRKKLETDSRIKIVNIRGIGYKLVMDV